MARRRALIVDDSKTAQYRLKKLLRGYDLDIVAVDSAEAALSYLSGSMPDVVFMDHLMPGMDGFRALQIIKSHPATATIPVIMYTSKSGDLYTSEARALGALDVVSKDTINAADLRKVLKSIRIYERTAVEAEAGSETPTAADTAALARPPADLPVPEEAPEKILSVELRLRELEHAIDDNRRIITSRLVREMQGVRHEVRKLVEQNSTLRLRADAKETEPTPLDQEAPQLRNQTTGGRLWPLTASVLLVTLVGGAGYWVHGVARSLDAVASAQMELNGRLAQQVEEQVTQPVVAEAQPSPHQVRERSSLALLPDLTWAFNQNSVQDFHGELISPQLVQRLTELLSRLANRDFVGTVRISVSGGDFCVVTNLSGHPQLPEAGAVLGDCMLMSELFGADVTLPMMERLRSSLTESEVMSNRAIELQVQPMPSTFAGYPALHVTTPAVQWNEAARQNNRVLIQLEPASGTRSVRRN